MHGFYSTLLVSAIAFLLAGFVKGVIGMGLPTVAIGFLSLAMAPSEPLFCSSFRHSSPISGSLLPAQISSH